MDGNSPPATIQIEVDGPIADHNFPCPVCQKEHAVLQMNTGVSLWTFSRLTGDTSAGSTPGSMSCAKTIP